MTNEIEINIPHKPTDMEKLAIIDAAIDVWAYYKMHNLNIPVSLELMEFMAKLDGLEQAIARAYPQAIHNIRKQSL